MWLTYCIIAVLLVALELVYFKVADRYNIIDKPNERSSHTMVVLRGGGIIFAIGLWVWSAFFGFQYPWLLVAVTLAAGVSFVDDIHSLPDGVRLVTQFVAMGLMLFQLMTDNGEWTIDWWWKLLIVVAGLIVCVGATNIYNFMDGINGITGAYSLAVLLPLLIVDGLELGVESSQGFIEPSYLVVTLLAVLVFSYFNFRPKGKAKCFAGDVGSISIAFILLFAIGKLIMKTGDASWLIFLIVYGVDGCSTILHRIMLHERLGEAHRKHAFQLMANELGMSHITVSLIYMVLQLAISLVMIYFIPNTVQAHWIYLIVVLLSLELSYLLFMKKYYHLHEEYLASLG